MPLVELVTDFKSLKYSKDTPGGGWSGQPYIQSKIPEGLSPKSPDFLLRNGYLSPLDSAEDIKRLTKMFGDLKSPNGLFFVAKQNILSNSAARTQTSGIMNEGVYTPLSTLAQAGVVATGFHLNKQGINPFRETGAYAQGDWLYNSKVKSYQPLGENRLYKIYEGVTTNTVTGLDGFRFNEGGTNVLSYKGGPGAPLGVGNTNIRFTNVRTGEASGINFKQYQIGLAGSETDRLDLKDKFYLISTAQGSSFKYQSLAIKAAGVNEASAKINNDIEQANSFNVYTQGNTWPTTSPLIYANNTFTYNQVDLINTPSDTGKTNGSPKIQDFRAILRKNLGETTPEANKATALGATPIAPNYETKNIEKRVNIGGADGAGPGARSGKSYASYTKGVQYTDGRGSVGAQDLINALPIYRNSSVDTTKPVNDLVKFRIAAIDGSNPEFKTFMHFRGFINSFSDAYSADWGSVRYLGRGEKFYNYNGFDRSISLSFTVAALSKPELIPMYKKLNYLASNLTPDYSPEGYMRGPLIQLTVGGYLYEQVGFISQLNYDIPNDSPWEIGINDTAGRANTSSTRGLTNLERLSDSEVKELPHIINVSSFSFTPIHNFRPGKQGLGFTQRNEDGKYVGSAAAYGNQRYIALEAINNNYGPVYNE